ncbi:hypothetical protein AAF712_014553 [Marasmius tenuissimus]|uniref:YTH domain-containing protein n=1 Tax=Marasmius tenuissimus TaxID=585030 RepID=A0ABR2ZBW4_9AGAR
MASEDILARSVDTGVWSSQNELFDEELERASRTSLEVFVIFALERKDEFWGYAKIAGTSWPKEGRPSSPLAVYEPVIPSEEPPQDMTEGDFPPAPQVSLLSSLFATLSEASPHETSGLSNHANFSRSPGHLSPVPMTGDETPHSPPDTHDSPLKNFRPPPKISVSPPHHFGLDSVVGSPLALSGWEDQLGKRSDVMVEGGSARKKDHSLDEFTVEWICTDRLPYSRTRHIRNPWNDDREVRLSNDGHELEPGVGQQLIDEWQRYVVERRAGGRGFLRRRQAESSASSG